MQPGLDFGIAGRTAIVCGSSKGLGRACAVALARVGVDVVVNGRNQDAVEKTALEIERLVGRKPRIVAADVTTPAGREALLAACPEPDILINNAGGPPPGDFRNFGDREWQDALNANMLTPIALIRATIDAMARRKWGRIINITSGAVKAPLPILGLSNGARAGLTGFVAGLAREVAGSGITINNILPGHFDTERLRSYATALAAKQGTSFDTVWANLAAANPSKRFGRPEEFGAVCAFLASEHAAYITGQNLLLDGGAFPGVF
jgi:3-oxoacyl-[acyl-carrier protein] reductase